MVPEDKAHNSVVEHLVAVGFIQVEEMVSMVPVARRIWLADLVGIVVMHLNVSGGLAVGAELMVTQQAAEVAAVILVVVLGVTKTLAMVEVEGPLLAIVPLFGMLVPATMRVTDKSLSFPSAWIKSFSRRTNSVSFALTVRWGSLPLPWASRRGGGAP